MPSTSHVPIRSRRRSAVCITMFARSIELGLFGFTVYVLKSNRDDRRSKYSYAGTRRPETSFFPRNATSIILTVHMIAMKQLNIWFVVNFWRCYIDDLPERCVAVRSGTNAAYMPAPRKASKRFICFQAPPRRAVLLYNLAFFSFHVFDGILCVQTSLGRTGLVFFMSDARERPRGFLGNQG